MVSVAALRRDERLDIELRAAVARHAAGQDVGAARTGGKLVSDPGEALVHSLPSFSG
jgi:hypothetical protein